MVLMGREPASSVTQMRLLTSPSGGTILGTWDRTPKSDMFEIVSLLEGVGVLAV
jgi:hypothetical protein